MTSAKKPPTHDDRCGEARGYQAHHRRGEVACDACKKANSVRNSRYSKASRLANRDRAIALGVQQNEVRREYRNGYRCTINARQKMISMDDVMFAAVYFTMPLELQKLIDAHYGEDNIEQMLGELTGEEYARRAEIDRIVREKEEQRRLYLEEKLVQAREANKRKTERRRMRK